MSHRITVVGAANVDICATPQQEYIPRDSNPAKVEITFGGVGRNIAHNLALRGCQTRLLTVFGTDSLASALIDNCLSAGIHLTPLHHVEGARSNFFVCINDHHGEMQAGAADTTLMERLTTDIIDSELTQLNTMDAVVADCNIGADVLLHLYRHLHVPLYVDATSAAKADRLTPLIDACARNNRCAPLTIKVNRAEATTLTANRYRNTEDCARALADNGLHRVYVTCGADGVCAAMHKSIVTLPANRVANVVNSTGAGDAFLAAAVAAELDGADLRQTVQTAMHAAALTLQCPNAVNPAIANINNNPQPLPNHT